MERLANNINNNNVSEIRCSSDETILPNKIRWNHATKQNNFCSSLSWGFNILEPAGTTNLQNLPKCRCDVDRKVKSNRSGVRFSHCCALVKLGFSRVYFTLSRLNAMLIRDSVHTVFQITISNCCIRHSVFKMWHHRFLFPAAHLSFHNRSIWKCIADLNLDNN